MQSWFQFCESKVAGIEKTWNRKLEQSEPDPPAQAEEPQQEEEFDHEATIEAMFANFNPRNLGPRGKQDRIATSNDNKPAEITETKEEEK